MEYGKSLNNPSPVVSLTIVDSSTLDQNRINERTRMLLVVRSDETNRTHPNVISVPTQRIPKPLLDAILQSSFSSRQVHLTTFFSSDEISNSSTSGHNPLIYTVESILSRKLRLSEALETEKFTFGCRLYALRKGKSYHPNLSLEDGREEYISMANILVSVFYGIDLVPTTSASYSHIFWTDVKHFVETMQNRDPLIINLNPIEYCLHGQCILTSYQIMAYELGIEDYLDGFV